MMTKTTRLVLQLGRALQSITAIAKPRDLANPGWEVTLESTDKQFWLDSLQRSIAKASTVLPFLS